MGAAFLFLLALQPAGKSLFLRVGTVGVNAKDSESLFDGAFHFGGENALPVKVRHRRVQIGNIDRTVEQPLEGICRKLLAHARTVEYFPPVMVDERDTIDTSLFIFPEYHINACFL